MTANPSGGNLAPQHHGFAPRVEKLNNQEITSAGGARLVIPDPEVMAALALEDPRIRHFPTPNQGAFQASPIQTIGESDYFRLVIGPLSQAVTAEFPGIQLALRAVGVSINGRIDPEEAAGFALGDVTETVSQGAEKADAVFNVELLDPQESLTVHQIAHYANNMAGAIAWDMSPQASAAVFPAVLVYDSSGLQAVKGDYGVSFREGHDPSQVLLAAYVLDKPV